MATQEEYELFAKLLNKLTGDFVGNRDQARDEYAALKKVTKTMRTLQSDLEKLHSVEEGRQ